MQNELTADFTRILCLAVGLFPDARRRDTNHKRAGRCLAKSSEHL